MRQSQKNHLPNDPLIIRFGRSTEKKSNWCHGKICFTWSNDAVMFRQFSHVKWYFCLGMFWCFIIFREFRVFSFYSISCAHSSSAKQRGLFTPNWEFQWIHQIWNFKLKIPNIVWGQTHWNEMWYKVKIIEILLPPIVGPVPKAILPSKRL